MLNGVDASAPNDIWAAGFSNSGFGSLDRTLVEHWNGTTWSVVPSPNRTGFNNVFQSVAAVGPNDVWAVGYRYRSCCAFYPHAEHWNGTDWSIVPTAKVKSGQLLGVSTNGKRLWAVGRAGTGLLAERWTGGAWERIADPAPTKGSLLLGISVTTDSPVWSVGTTGGQVHHGLTQEWVGAWKTVASTPSAWVLFAVAVVGPDDVWAVGDTRDASAYAEHWNGIAWKSTQLPVL